jgi:uncharacterized membrane protein
VAVLGVILGGSALVLGLMFSAMGAVPVAGFMGVEIAGFFFALWLFRRRQEIVTEVRVSADTIRLRHRVRGQAVVEVSLPTYFTTVSLNPEPATGVRLRAAGRAYRVGGFMSRAECAGFADALQAALRAARAERYQSADQTDEAVTA